MVNDWTPYEEDLLVENLEMGYDLVAVSMHVQRDPEDVAKKVVDLSLRGVLVILSTSTLEAWLKRSSQ